MVKTNQTSLLYPDYVTSSVLALQADELKKVGITHIALDVDETIVPKNHNDLTPEYIAFLQGLEKTGFQLLIVSNSGRDLRKITQHFNAVLVPPTSFAFKPFKKYFSMVITAAGTDAQHIAMVGDKVLNDIIGANHAGLKTILVEPYARRQKIYNRIYLTRALRLQTRS